MVIVPAYDVMAAVARALEEWAPDDTGREEARMIYTAAAQMLAASTAAYQVQVDDRIPVPDWVRRYLP